MFGTCHDAHSWVVSKGARGRIDNHSRTWTGKENSQGFLSLSLSSSLFLSLSLSVRSAPIDPPFLMQQVSLFSLSLFYFHLPLHQLEILSSSIRGVKYVITVKGTAIEDSEAGKEESHY